MRTRVLAQIPLFADTEPGFISALCLRIKMISLSPRERIFSVGDVGKEMFVIKKVSHATQAAQRLLLAPPASALFATTRREYLHAGGRPYMRAQSIGRCRLRKACR